MVLGKLLVPGRPTIGSTVGQGPTALVVGAGGGCLDFLLLSILFTSLSPSLWETVRYRLKYCLKGPLNPKQPTNQLLEFRQPQKSQSILGICYLFWDCLGGKKPSSGRITVIHLHVLVILEGKKSPLIIELIC